MLFDFLVEHCTIFFLLAVAVVMALVTRRKPAQNTSKPAQHTSKPVGKALPTPQPTTTTAISPCSTMDNLQRLDDLRGKVIVFVGAGSSPEKRSIYESVRALGVKSVVLDGPGSWASSMVEDNTIAGYYPVVFESDPEATLRNMCRAIASIAVDIGAAPDGVCTFFEIAVPIATQLAASLGLPSNPIEAVAAARDKHATRRISAAVGLPTPKHASITCEADLVTAGRVVSFPAVIKPIGMFQSMGVLRVDSQEELETAYGKVLAELEVARVAAEGTKDYRATVANLGAKMVLEEFLDGDEQVVDIVLQDGECRFASVTDNWPATRSFEAAQGKFNETGASSPSVLTPSQQEELIDLGVASTLALGFRHGVFCLNLKYTTRGARLIEINSRMGGMFVRDHNKLCWGVDLVEEHLLCTVGLPCHPPKAPAPLRASAGVYVSAEATGIVTDDDVLRHYAGSSEFVYLKPMVKEGDSVLGPLDAADFPTWLCGFMLTAPTAHEAIARAKAVNDDIVARVRVATHEAPAAQGA